MQSFIKARLNKDNFWNVMFFFGMFAGISAAFATNVMILSWITIVGVIWFVKRNLGDTSLAEIILIRSTDVRSLFKKDKIVS